MSRLFLPILLVIASSVVAGQNPTKTRSVKARPAPQIDVKARFRSLDSTTPISLADYQGKVVVLALWASWCAPCRDVMYGLVDLYKDVADRGVQVIALSVEDPQKAQADVQRFVDGLHPDYKVGWISRISANKLMTRDDVVPQIFVIQDGIVLKSFIGWSPTMTMIGVRKVLDEVQEKKPAS